LIRSLSLYIKGASNTANNNTVHKLPGGKLCTADRVAESVLNIVKEPNELSIDSVRCIYSI
jgi:hypothetical protein